MKSTVVVLHSEKQDAVATALRDVKGVAVMHLDQLTCLWTIREAAPIVAPRPVREPMLHAGYVINRIFDISRCDIGAKVREYGLHENWIHAALGSVLAGTTTLAHGVGRRGVNKSLLPLNVQWALISDLVPDIRVPSFAFGFGHRMPDTSHLKNPIQKSVWSYFKWDGTPDVEEGEEQWHPFFVERPEGVPVVCSYHGDALDLEFPRGEVLIDVGVAASLVAACRETFDSRIGEILLYAHGTEITFCAFSPYLATLGDPGRSRDLLLRGMPFSFV
ncbi:TPA: hypothetical protein UMB92_000535 [Stenotrophomonas maltophilia]|nr:hypothetical protein [Stenotrophomonas maltophilia]